MSDGKSGGDWVLWSAFELVIGIYTFLGIRHQMSAEVVEGGGDRLPVVWLFGGIAVALLLVAELGGRKLTFRLGRQLLQWGIYNCLAVLGLVLGYLALPPVYWLPFPLLATAMMVVHRPRAGE